MSAHHVTLPSKPYTWSYSRLKNFETCPKRSWHVDIARDIKEPESPQLLDGNLLHAAMAARIGPKRVQLPLGMEYMEPWANMLLQAAQGGRIATEVKVALDKNFDATTYFGKNVWFRGVLDVLIIKGNMAIVGDWKTGRMTEDNPQLALFAQCVFSTYSMVDAVRTEFFWTANQERTRRDFRRADMPAFWAEMLPRVSRMERAHATSEYPAKPGRLCANWCPVHVCAYHNTRQG